MKLVGFDVETPQEIEEYSLQPWRATTGEANIKSYAAWSDDGLICGAKKMPSRKTLKRFLNTVADNDYVLVGWNLLFDVAWLAALGLIADLKRCRMLDAMLLLKHIDVWLDKQYGGPGFGLKAEVASRWPEHAAYANDVNVLKVPKTDDEWRSLLKYNLDDSRFTCLLAREYLDILSPSEVRNCLIEASSIPDVALSYIHGIYINEEAIKPFRHEVNRMEAEAMPVFGAGMDVVRSPKKLGELIFDKWGYDPIATTAAGNRSTNKQSLMTLALENPDDLRFGAMMKLRKCNTKLSKFIGGTIKSIAYHGSNITRPCPAISGTMTGRFTYSSTQGKNKSLIQTGIALHQWERDKTTRDLLAAPPGFLLAEFDFSGQEMRLMAILSDDDVMLDLFESGGDGHAYMGSSIEGVDYDWVRDNADTDKNAKEIRNLGKFSNLSLQYRIGVDSIMARALTQYSLQLTRHKAQHIKTTYLNTYKRVPQYWKDAQAIAAEKGYAETLGGRRIPLNNLSSYQQQQTAINYPVQGTGGDMKSLALNVTRHLFDSNFIYGWDLHDALFVYIRNDRKAKGKIHAFRKILSNLPYEKAWGWTPVIDLPVDAKVGRTWGTLKALD